MSCSFLLALCVTLLAGCGGETAGDSARLTGDIKKIVVSISGLSKAGERIQYSPVIKNGHFKQKLVPGQYRFDRSALTVHFESREFTLDLMPVGDSWPKSQDAAAGIVQNFIWKPTGQAETHGQTSLKVFQTAPRTISSVAMQTGISAGALTEALACA